MTWVHHLTRQQENQMHFKTVKCQYSIPFKIQTVMQYNIQAIVQPINKLTEFLFQGI